MIANGVQMMQQHELRNQCIMINEFWGFDLTIKWELVGYDQWAEIITMNGDVFADEVAMPVFRYFLRWAGKSMSFLIMYRPVENQVYQGTRELQTVDVRGDEPAWNWRRRLDIGDLYAEAEEQSYLGKESGIMIPTWIDIVDRYAC
jgi:hypothetical protein